MSCIAGIVNLVGSPVDRDILERMTGVMSPRAPDELNIWAAGPVGFGHAMLRTSAVSQREHQPFTLDGKVWVCADARVDGRKELVSKLRGLGAQLKADASDPELILQSYQLIGKDFLEHLIGDFAFALWDERTRQLICARDHFGVRPFFYVKTDTQLLFASHIIALQQHPAVSRQLDEGFIADLLLFCGSLDEEATVFSNIRRFPRSTVFLLEQGRIRVRKYWKLSEYQEPAQTSDAEYLEEFSELFTTAVTDRAAMEGTAIELSGGMDSGAIAATLRAGDFDDHHKVFAHSVSCAGLFEDDEDRFTELTASALGIEVEYQRLADYRIFQTPEYYARSEEPQSNPNLAVQYNTRTRVSAQGARVVLSGQGGDSAFGATLLNPAKRFEARALFELFSVASKHFLRFGSFRGAGIRAHFGRVKAGQLWQPPIPSWINPEFAHRIDISDRWHSGWQRINSGVNVHRQMTSGFLNSLFEGYERPELPIVVRHPFFDIRLVSFLAKLPNRLKTDKLLLRNAMEGKLPDQVCRRPKTPLAGDLVRSQLLNTNDAHIIKQSVSKECSAFVNGVSFARGFDQFIAESGNESTWLSAILATPVCLSLWMKGPDLEN